MSEEKLVKSIEIPAKRNMNWYYHALQWEDIIDYSPQILLKGLKCGLLLYNKAELFNKYYNYNGYHYISLSKDMGELSGNSSYEWYQDYIGIIIDRILAIKCNAEKDYSKYRLTTLPLRNSCYYDEYQAFRSISPRHYVGIRCSALDWYKRGEVYKLKYLKELISIMQYHRIRLSIYDYSRVEGKRVHLINPIGYLTNFDEIIENAQKFKDDVKKILTL